MSKEQDLDLTGAAPTAKPKKTDETTTQEQVNRIEESIPDLSGLSTPGQTNEQFLDQLLNLDTEKLIPWEEAHLPSRGRYYGWPDGVVQVRAMGHTVEKILSTQRLAQSGQAVNMMLKECVRLPDGFDVSHLLIGDQTFLLYFIRGITHGNNYDFGVTCPSPDCKQFTTHSYDLNELAQTIVWANDRLGTEPFKVVLPFLSAATGREVWVGLRFLRVIDTMDIINRQRATKRMMAKPGNIRTRSLSGMKGGTDPRRQAEDNQQLDDQLSLHIEKMVATVMGNNDPIAVRRFLEKLHAQDIATIREWLKENTPGIDTTVSLSCPSCSQEFTMAIPISENFFRPTKR